jgi:hypothetical protein
MLWKSNILSGIPTSSVLIPDHIEEEINSARTNYKNEPNFFSLHAFEFHNLVWQAALFFSLFEYRILFSRRHPIYLVNLDMPRRNEIIHPHVFMADATMTEYRPYTPYTINIYWQWNRYFVTHQSNSISFFYYQPLQHVSRMTIILSISEYWQQILTV